VVVGVAVIAVFRFPAPRDRLPFRPLPLLGLLGYLAYDMVVSGVGVSWQTLRYGPAARGAVLAVPLLSRSDRVVAVIANSLSLSPGTMALQIDQEHGLWFVYALGPRDRAGVERTRRRTLDMQRRVIAALGTPDELAAARRLQVQVGGGGG
jgi:multicomponent Na+:H+ antiporter subunit E